MPKKRPHRKSRFGCDQCRKRRVKCDESLPRCSICTGRDEQCYYSRSPQPWAETGGHADGDRDGNHGMATVALPDRGGGTITGTMRHSTQESSPSSASMRSATGNLKNISRNQDATSSTPSSSVRDTLLYATTSLEAATPPPPSKRGGGSTDKKHRAVSDLALMHHWCTRTCHSFTPTGARLFSEYVGQLALRHDYLMEALQALTLLHMATERELEGEGEEEAGDGGEEQGETHNINLPSIDMLLGDALEHLNRSVSGLREVLGNLSFFHYDAACTTSMLIMVCAILSPLLPSELNGRNREPAAKAILSLAHYMNGLASVVECTRPWIRNGPMADIVDIVKPRPEPGLHWPAEEDLRKALESRVDKSEPRYATLDNAIMRLRMVYRRELCGVEWMPSVGEDFAYQLQRGDIVSMLILMHWAVLLYTGNDMWWKRYAGSKLVEELSVVLTGHDPGCEAMIRRCRTEIGLSVPLEYV